MKSEFFSNFSISFCSSDLKWFLCINKNGFDAAIVKNIYSKIILKEMPLEMGHIINFERNRPSYGSFVVFLLQFFRHQFYFHSLNLPKLLTNTKLCCEFRLYFSNTHAQEIQHVRAKSTSIAPRVGLILNCPCLHSFAFRAWNEKKHGVLNTYSI